MDKVIATILLVVASTICCVVVFNAMYPAITSSGESIIAQSAAIGERVKSGQHVPDGVNVGQHRFVTGAERL